MKWIRWKNILFFLFYLLMMTDYLHFCLFENDNKFRKTSAYIKMVAMKWKTWQYRDWSGYLVDFFFLFFFCSSNPAIYLVITNLFCFQLSCLSEFTCVNRNFFLFIYRQNEKRKKNSVITKLYLNWNNHNISYLGDPHTYTYTRIKREREIHYLLIPWIYYRGNRLWPSYTITTTNTTSTSKHQGHSIMMMIT